MHFLKFGNPDYLDYPIAKIFYRKTLKTLGGIPWTRARPERTLSKHRFARQDLEDERSVQST